MAARLLAAGLFLSPLLAGADAGGLAGRVDQIRLPARDSVSTLEIRHVTKPSQPPEISLFKVFTRVFQESGRQQTSTLLVCTSPEKDAGKRLLFLDNACWFFDPRAKRPARISAAQMWSQPMSADSASWRLAEDFTAARAGTETIPCGDGVTRQCTVIDFVPASKSLPAPARMRYWVDDSGRYWRIQHFTASGRLFRTIDNIRFQGAPGAWHMTGMTILSGAESAAVTFSNTAFRESPREWFEPENLPLIHP